MSKCYHIQCDDCKQTLWVGQNDYIYTAKPEITIFAKFLHDHENHKLSFVYDENTGEDYEDLSDYDEKKD